MKKYLFLNAKENEEMLRLQNYYKISQSTIANIIWEELITEKCFEEYTYENVRLYHATIERRTQIKWYKHEHMETLNQSARVIANAIIYYMEKNPKQHIKARIEKRFRETKEENWDFNRKFRQQCRMIRNNKEYFKKLLGE